jgi:hypothetical protein
MQHLRALCVDPKMHPRSQDFISSASGLVCAFGKVYVIADDEHHLAVFEDQYSDGHLIRLFDGDLPNAPKRRKKLKPDLESLFIDKNNRLIALGSGSGAESGRARSRGVIIPLKTSGNVVAPIEHFDLTPIYEVLIELLGQINIEGSMLIDDQWLLLNRGVANQSKNALIRYPAEVLFGLISGDQRRVKPSNIENYDLGTVEQVPYTFTDATALPGGGWIFTAAAEDTSDSYLDGRCLGSIIGRVDRFGKIIEITRLQPLIKVEGIAAHIEGSATRLCLVTDSDDSSKSASLLSALLP